MSVEWCKTCGEIMFGGSHHHCPPAWKIWSPEDGRTEDDADIYYGMGPEAAVEKWAQWYDSHSADYSIVGGSEATVHVRYVGELERAEFLRLPTEECVFRVYGESVPSYTAHRAKGLEGAKP